VSQRLKYMRMSWFRTNLVERLCEAMLTTLIRNGVNRAGSNVFDSSIPALLPNRSALAAVEDIDTTIRRLEKIDTRYRR
jgi:hypothetical protein